MTADSSPEGNEAALAVIRAAAAKEMADGDFRAIPRRIWDGPFKTNEKNKAARGKGKRGPKLTLKRLADRLDREEREFAATPKNVLHRVVTLPKIGREAASRRSYLFSPGYLSHFLAVLENPRISLRVKATEVTNRLTRAGLEPPDPTTVRRLLKKLKK